MAVGEVAASLLVCGAAGLALLEEILWAVGQGVSLGCGEARPGSSFWQLAEAFYWVA